jgi:hypothetical protein
MAGPGRDDDHDEEVRFAVVLHRGVSLAIWMGGVTYEIDRLTGTWPGADNVYGRVLDLVQARAHADVIVGTSMGGINGVFLALARRTSTPSYLECVTCGHPRAALLLRCGARCRRCCAATTTSYPSCARPSRESCTRQVAT